MLGVFNHFTSKHLTRTPWFVSTSSALLCKKAFSEQMNWARSLLTRVIQGRSPHLPLQRNPWVPLPLQQDPSDQWNTLCTPKLFPWTKDIKERTRFCLMSRQWQCNCFTEREKPTMPDLFSLVQIWQCSRFSLLSFHQAQKLFGVPWKSCKQTGSKILAFVVTKQSQKTGS